MRTDLGGRGGVYLTWKGEEGGLLTWGSALTQGQTSQPREQTDAYENITFSHTSYVVGNKSFKTCLKRFMWNFAN